MQEVIGSTPLFSTALNPRKGIFWLNGMAYFTYIIYSSKIDKYYIGYTENLVTRLSQHNSGISTYTASADDWTLQHSEQFNTRQEAMKREKVIKAKKSRKYIEWLINSAG